MLSFPYGPVSNTETLSQSTITRYGVHSQRQQGKLASLRNPSLCVWGGYGHPARRHSVPRSPSRFSWHFIIWLKDGEVFSSWNELLYTRSYLCPDAALGLVWRGRAVGFLAICSRPPLALGINVGSGDLWLMSGICCSDFLPYFLR